MSTEEFMKECWLHNESQAKYVSDLVKQDMEVLGRNTQSVVERIPHFQENITWVKHKFNIDLGKNVIHIEKTVPISELIALFERNNYNPSEWFIAGVFVEPDNNEV